MLLHQGIGLDAFNALSERKAVHALYECCNSMTMSRHLAYGRPYENHDALFRKADALLFALSESAVDQILDACPDVGRRPRSDKSQAEQCSVWDEDAAVMAQLGDSARAYAEKFGFGFVMCCGAMDAHTVLASVSDRLHNDVETERKVVRNELAKINRSRLERMLGPEGGYQNW
ncbi:2-oxo-4-hydroxy-4-carboxy-5-ureidoimidazoline decarboxylase [Mycobacterium antarcticum]|uniref:2-oxo-4-hydroxy-4-carboxy-5-ureidoimidazoline decarboxylase n=1 Tax=unclassified Mycolicibacterium TaxID=2636767 RepID=UPI0023A3408F|nr:MULTISPECIES: 2-oxo-4-hydroxy-4-carboxy-5-ureidoimidazoline decarboxylase [unclassified Mycolicibacterium]BDX30023.1 2-oxo-4-hydroxy-4-carboxy-5-ureidoimidazoline decarboxylase [Mycolicibacterium sp. TUM20985]GLP79158.1 2-oxo-4-hydroxy-4-carboxy-5-ureidoimidazoline decarboxylase [Mycolicibacterium sp. TUM20984]